MFDGVTIIFISLMFFLYKIYTYEPPFKEKRAAALASVALVADNLLILKDVQGKLEKAMEGEMYGTAYEVGYIDGLKDSHAIITAHYEDLIQQLDDAKRVA